MSRFLALFAALAVTCAPVRAQDVEVAPGVYVVPGARERSVSFRMIVKAGCADEEPTCLGTAHFLEHLVLTGRNAQHADQALRFFADGASNGWTLHAATGFSHSFPAGADAHERLDRLFAFYAARLGDFSATPAEAERERAVVRQEHDWRVAANPYAPVWRQAARFFFGDHPLGRWPIGDPEAIAGYSLEGARDFHARWYRRPSVAFVVAGPVEVERIRMIAERRLEAAGGGEGRPARGWLAPPPLPEETWTVSHADARIPERATTWWKAVRLDGTLGDPVRQAALRWVAAEFLTSRLAGSPHAELVDGQGLARLVRDVAVEIPMQGVALVSLTAAPAADVAPDHLAHAIVAYVEDLATRGVDASTLARLKQRHALAHERDSAWAQSRAARIADRLALPGPDVDPIARVAAEAEAVASLTVDDVGRFLAAVAGPGRTAMLHFLPAVSQ
ncbi:MAG: insulinase family protein [Rhizobiales bacterium]|nr:insulinase family protein [Hyphomicrobiales bacterium]